MLEVLSLNHTVYAIRAPGTMNGGATAIIVTKDNITDARTLRVLENEDAIAVSIVSKSLENRFKIRPKSRLEG